MNRRLFLGLAGVELVQLLIPPSARSQTADEIWQEHQRRAEQMWTDHERSVNQMWADHQRQVEKMWAEHERYVNQMWQDQSDFLHDSQRQQEDYAFQIHGSRITIDQRLFQEDKESFKREIEPNLENLIEEAKRREAQERRKSDYTQREEKKPTPQEIEAKRKIEAYRARQQTLKGFAHKAALTNEEFSALVATVETIADYKLLMRERRIHYTPDTTPTYATKIADLYGPSLKTWNDRTGVCDELAVLPLPFLANMKDVRQIYLTEIEQPDVNLNHAFTVYENTNGEWGYINNTHVVSPKYASREHARNAAAKETGYNPLLIRFDERRIEQSGDWVFDSNKSEKLRPDRFRR